MKKILVPIDFSKESINALDMAYSLAKKSKSAIELLHIEESIHHETFSSTGEHFGNGLDQVFMIKLLQKVKHKMKVAATNPKYKGVKINQHVEFGNPYNVVSDFSIKNKIDLIVIGSRGMRAHKNIFVGSMTQKLIKNSPVPIFMMHQNDLPKDIKKLVLATSGVINGKIITTIQLLQKFLNFSVDIVRVVTPNNFKSLHEAEAEINDVIKKYKIKNTTISVYPDLTLEEGILNFTSKLGADVIALEYHHRTIFESFFDPSLSMVLAKKVKFPVLITGE